MEEIYDLSFVILTWNSQNYIARCLNSIDQITSMRVKIYVIDNGSKDRTISILQKLQHSLHYAALEIISLPDNKGTTISRNIGLKKACRNSSYICILDSDTVVNEQAMKSLMQSLKSYQDIGIIGPVMKGLDGTVQNSGRGIPTFKLKLFKALPVTSLRRKGEQMEQVPKKDAITNVGYLMSACWMIPVKVVEKIGFLDENIFYAPEDVEYCMRAWKNGYRVAYNNQAYITHAWQRLSRKKL
ncbi:glycosyltransferase family 2 protein, partial [uncultured Dialister sp.]|uniref:glycosyltransferase family 2 protein n=1 Tax=uncultured Dialister sp. TaxID=278064 RepID=UPI0025E490DF